MRSPLPIQSHLVIASLLLLLTGGTAARADTIIQFQDPIHYEQTGQFSQDNSTALFYISLSLHTDLEAFTTSWQALAGFPTVLSLYTTTMTNLQSTDVAANDLLIATDSGGIVPDNCGKRGVDATYGYCLDAYLQLSLDPGVYVLALTQAPNTTLDSPYSGTTLADGFTRQSEPNFTATDCGFTQTDQLYQYFVASGALGCSNTLNGTWALTVKTTLATPEPATGGPALLLFGVAALLGRYRSRHRRRATPGLSQTH